jgi:hypothetical protein
MMFFHQVFKSFQSLQKSTSSQGTVWTVLASEAREADLVEATQPPKGIPQIRGGEDEREPEAFITEE